MERGDGEMRPQLEDATLSMPLLNKNLPGEAKEEELCPAWIATYGKMENRSSEAQGLYVFPELSDSFVPF